LAWTALAVVSPCRAATYHVSPNGSDTPPYDSYPKAANKIDVALLAAGGYGDTVLVHAGIYNIDTTIYLPQGLVWAGVGRDSVRINWSYPEYEAGILARALGDNEVFGLEFNYPMGSSFNDNVRAIYGFALDTLMVHDARFRHLMLAGGGATYLHAHDNEFYFATTRGISWGGAFAYIHDNVFRGRISGRGVHALVAYSTIIERNYFDTDETGGAYEAIYMDNGGIAEVRNNIILNSWRAVSWYETPGVIENNTLIRTTEATTGLAVFQEPDQELTIRNNVMANFSRPPQFGPMCSICPATGPITFVHNVLWPPRDSTHVFWKFASPDSVTLLDSANVFALPMFVAEENCGVLPDSSFFLQQDSPLINAGDPALLDVDGSRSDIGRWGGPGGAITTHPDQPPLSPAPVSYDYDFPEVALIWSPSPEADILWYGIHREAYEGFTPTVDNRIGLCYPPDTVYVDTLGDTTGGVFYKVVAVDLSQNWCDAEAVVVVSTGVFEPGDPQSPIPREPGVVSAYPNPFNAGVTLVVSLPASRNRTDVVAIQIIDVLGRLVRQLSVNGESNDQVAVVWDGRVDSGVEAASGVYFARLSVGGVPLGSVSKLVLVR